MSRIAEPLEDAIRSRHSIRRFLPTPVPREQILHLLDLAACAPSGVNTQPWHVYVLTGESRQKLTDALLAEFANPSFERRGEYDYYPAQWTEPYRARRRDTGQRLYSLLGIEKGDNARMQEQWARNYAFFDAPVGLIFTLDRVLGQGSLIDYGAFLQTLMIAARGAGLDTCVQAAFTEYHPVIRAQLQIPEAQMVLCGMSLGHADPDAPENRLVLPRIPASGFTQFRD
ncbi:MAG: nitrobenzoate reductase [Candidatus Dactylopiibacterium carminicum]|uniref:Nitrobenzoate reductase n=1 Tax=Candidatus Dactylopiibacterium carminicum TaxID=857335 RepID=A0A272EVQ1_9RHOO|nr:nitroreductase family protein [Candidatus Dactylopiibacterium carminicum]KAF7599873.1 nitrobenzoate reductase [Candidatus Dactylopiibacterium carminicum]PAS94188.1 MAG: nitrobenzoate reductase [Candidatus Dactylopiibacterium carminicum]PAS96740.1 MAG: nitrobenzoate reductase [Candidatus Dactylopiibacterium carminicum]PAS99873.1 MAG: nitrobenzoate reductase [Candidatus Dactylopiibacterium carminicum]